MTAPTPNAMPGAAAAAQPAGGQQPPAAAQPQQQPAGAPTAPAAQPGQPQSGQQPDAPGGSQTPPPWEAAGQPFDPRRAWNTIQNQRTENETLKSKLSAAQPILDEHERLRIASQSELDTVREQATTVTAERDLWRTQAVQGTAAALAATRFTYPDAAVQLLGDLSGYATAEGVDQTKLTAALDALGTKYPNMLSQAHPHGLYPDRAQGQSGAGGGAPSTIDAQIKAAEARGDFAASISLKQQKHAQQNAPART